jgi:hypothetical protein
MKKYFQVLMLSIILIFLIFSCKKSIGPEIKPDQMINSTNETELKIQSFLNRMSSQLKDEKTYSIDSAIWYSTATLNYTYAIYDSALIHLSRDTSTFSMVLDKDDKVTESDLENAFEQMVDSLEDFFEDLPVNTKHVVYCLVYEMNVYPERLDVGMVSVIGWGYSIMPYEPFDETDYWYAIMDYGKCGDYDGHGEGEDASDKLEQKIMDPRILYDPDWRIFTIPGSEEFFENVDPADYPFANASRGYRGYYYLGQAETWPGPQCLDPDELNFYIGSNGIDYIIDDLEPQGKEFISIDVYGELLWLPNDYYEEQHFFDITYGNKYMTIVPASSL